MENDQSTAVGWFSGWLVGAVYRTNPWLVGVTSLPAAVHSRAIWIGVRVRVRVRVRVPRSCAVGERKSGGGRGDAEAEEGGEHEQESDEQGDDGKPCCTHSDISSRSAVHWTHDARPCVKTTTNIKVNAAVNDCLLYRPLDLRPALAR